MVKTRFAISILITCGIACVTPAPAHAQTQLPGKCLAAPQPLDVLLRTADGKLLQFHGDTATTPSTVINGGVVSVSAGGKVTLVLMADGTVMQSREGKPFVRAPGIDNAIDIAAGRNHGAVLLADGTVRTWGEKTGGVPGDGTCPIRPCDIAAMSTSTRQEMEKNYPGCRCPKWTGQRPPEFDFTNVSDINDGIALTANTWQTWVIRRDGRVFGWGTNYESDRKGTIGVGGGFFILSPTQLPGIEKAVVTGASGGRGAVIMDDGRAMAWGAYLGPRLSDQEVEDAFTPVPQPIINGATQLTGSLALMPDGKVIGWNRADRKVHELFTGAGAILTDEGVFEGHVILMKDGRLIKWGGRRRFPKGPVEVGRVDEATAKACDASARVAHIRAQLSR